jgi:hypothetical protein
VTSLLGAFAKSPKAPIKLVMSACAHVSVPLALDVVPRTFMLGTSVKICPENPNLIKIGKTYLILYYFK